MMLRGSALPEPPDPVDVEFAANVELVASLPPYALPTLVGGWLPEPAPALGAPESPLEI